MYYGEMCIKVKGENEIIFYTRKPKGVNLDGVKTDIGGSLSIKVSDSDIAKTILLDFYTAVSKGMCMKHRDEDGNVTWYCKPGEATTIMTGPAIIEMVGYREFAEIKVSIFTEESMEPREVGNLRYTDTGHKSLVQKSITALENMNVTREMCYEYKRSVGDSTVW